MAVVKCNDKLIKVTKKEYKKALLQLATKGEVNMEGIGKEVGKVEGDLDAMTQDQALEALGEVI